VSGVEEPPHPKVISVRESATHVIIKVAIQCDLVGFRFRSKLHPRRYPES